MTEHRQSMPESVLRQSSGTTGGSFLFKAKRPRSRRPRTQGQADQYGHGDAQYLGKIERPESGPDLRYAALARAAIQSLDSPSARKSVVRSLVTANPKLGTFRPVDAPKPSVMPYRRLQTDSVAYLVTNGERVACKLDRAQLTHQEQAYAVFKSGLLLR